jgi:hypothetical protein
MLWRTHHVVQDFEFDSRTDVSHEGHHCLDNPGGVLQSAQTTIFDRPHPHVVLLMSLIIVSLSIVVWYATWFHYARWGWIITGFTTGLSLLSVENIRRWPKHRVRMLAVIEFARGTRFLDGCIVALGVAFLLLSVLVYPS